MAQPRAAWSSYRPRSPDFSPSTLEATRYTQAPADGPSFKSKDSGVDLQPCTPLRGEIGPEPRPGRDHTADRAIQQVDKRKSSTTAARLTPSGECREILGTEGWKRNLVIVCHP